MELLTCAFLLAAISTAATHARICDEISLGHFDCVGSQMDNDDFASLLLSLPANLTALAVMAPNAKLRNFFAMSQDFRRFPDLKTLRINHGTIQMFGEDIFPRKNSLEHLDVSKNLISHINQGSLARTRHLKYLDLSFNKLGKAGVPSGAFAKLDNLQSLNLAGNDIRTISHSVFQGLKSLKILNLAGNPISTSVAARLFAHSPNLAELNLENCRISTLPNDVFHFVPKLQKVSLAGNPLKEFPHAALLPLATELISIDLSNGKISQIKSYTFYDWSLRHLNLSGNRLSTGIHRNAFASSNIVTLGLANNDLSINDVKSIDSLALRLQHLDLSGNRLGMIPINFFDKFTSLKYLDLSNIGVSKIRQSFLTEHKSIQFLNLSHNEISKIPYGHFTKMRLNTLDLSHNKLTSFPSLGLTAAIPRLFLSGNPWVCGCRTFAFQSFLLELNQKLNQSGSTNDAARVRCSSPSSVTDRPIIELPDNAVPVCSAIFGAMGLTDQSEISILIAAGGAVVLVLALAAALACSYYIPKIRGRSSSKTNVSNASSDSCDLGTALRPGDTCHSDSSSHGAVAPVQPLHPEHKAFILEVEI